MKWGPAGVDSLVLCALHHAGCSVVPEVPTSKSGTICSQLAKLWKRQSQAKWKWNSAEQLQELMKRFLNTSLLYALYVSLPDFTTKLVLTLPWYRMERQSKAKGKVQNHLLFTATNVSPCLLFHYCCFLDCTIFQSLWKGLSLTWKKKISLGVIKHQEHWT